jgi:hypothetical protein
MISQKMGMNKLLTFCLLTSFSLSIQAQSITEKYQRFLTEPYGYVCYRTSEHININGVLDEASWKNAPYTNSFVDISGEGFPKPRYDTKAKLLWDDNYIYIGAELEDPNVWAYLTQRDTIVYYNNDFEVFIDPTGEANNYFELETNALGTVFDLSLEKPYRAPIRPFIMFQWNCPGLKLKTKVNGTLNNPNDKDKGWTVEMAIPRQAIAAEFDNYLKAGHYLRIGFSRVEWQYQVDGNGRYDRKKDADGKYLSEDNWTWGPTGQVAMHMPERWGYVYLSNQSSGSAQEEFHYPASRPVERLLWAMFYAQEDHFAKARCYFGDTSDFSLTAEELGTLPLGSTIKTEAISHKYEITITTPDGVRTVIDESGHIFRR